LIQAKRSLFALTRKHTTLHFLVLNRPDSLCCLDICLESYSNVHYFCKKNQGDWVGYGILTANYSFLAAASNWLTTFFKGPLPIRPKQALLLGLGQVNKYLVCVLKNFDAAHILVVPSRLAGMN